MNVTEVTVSLVRFTDKPQDKLRAFANFVLDGRFAVHGVKVIETKPGQLTVCMPNRKVTMACPKCKADGVEGRAEPEVTDDYCGRCGSEMPPFEERTRNYLKPSGKLDIHRDVCHPLDWDTRETISKAVLDKYREVLCRPTE